MSEPKLSRSIIIVLLLCNVVIYGQTVSFEFLIWDDEQYVVKHLERFGGRIDGASIHWSMTSRVAGWRTPITYLSYFLDAQLYGVKSWGLHLTNMVIHSCSTVLLFLVMRRMTGKTLASGFAAAIFAVHPLHVEPVAWVTGRWDLLYGFFWIAAMGAYLRYVRCKTVSSYLCLMFLYLWALWSKPAALTLPFSLLLLDLWPLNRIRWSNATERSGAESGDSHLVSPSRAILEKAPLFGIMAFELYWSAHAKSAFFVDRQPIRFTVPERLGNAVLSYVHYLYDFFVPHDLSFYYRHPVIAGGLDWTLVGWAVGLLAVLSIAAILALRSSKAWFVGWFWFLGTLVPSMGLLQVGHQARADRYMYIPLMGLVFIVAFAVPELLARLSRCAIQSWLAGVAIVMLLAGSVVSFKQASVWRNNEALFTHALQIDPRNYKAHVHFGMVQMRAGDHQRASESFRFAAETAPYKHAPYFTLAARSLAQEGKFSESDLWHQRAVELEPQSIETRYYYVQTLLESDRLDDALRQIEDAAKLPAAGAGFYQLLGEDMAREGHDSLAIRYFEQALTLEPRRKHVPLQLGFLLAKTRSQHEAVRFYREYHKRYPDRPDVANELAWTLATSTHDDLRSGDEAVSIAENLCRKYQERSPAVLDTLAAAYAEVGRFDDAVSAARRGLELARRVGSDEHVRGLGQRTEQYRRQLPYRASLAVSSDAKGSADR